MPDALAGVEVIDDDLDLRPGAGISPSNWSSGITPSLLPPRSTNMLLPRTEMTLPVAVPLRASWPRSRRPAACARSPVFDFSRATSKVLGSNPERAASISASISASHCRLSGNSGRTSGRELAMALSTASSSAASWGEVLLPPGC